MTHLHPTPVDAQQSKQAIHLISPRALFIPPNRAKVPNTPLPPPPPSAPRLTHEFMMTQLSLMSSSLTRSPILEDFDEMFEGEDLMSEEELKVSMRPLSQC